VAARDAVFYFIAGHLASFVTRPCQRSIKLAAEQLFDEPTRPNSHLSLDRSNQLSKRSKAIPAAGCMESGFVVSLVMA
jgi:hypothetical protein